MMVEDQVAEVTLMRKVLQDACPLQAEVVSVLYAEDAIALLEADVNFDVVILDLRLPKMSGYDLLRQYKPHFPPAVVFSSSWNPDDSKQVLALGAREFIHKPMHYDDYVSVVRGIVEKWCNRSLRGRGCPPAARGA
jgi:DNA-binding NarL/FixJ family response regulator